MAVRQVKRPYQYDRITLPSSCGEGVPGVSGIFDFETGEVRKSLARCAPRINEIVDKGLKQYLQMFSAPARTLLGV